MFGQNFLKKKVKTTAVGAFAAGSLAAVLAAGNIAFADPLPEDITSMIGAGPDTVEIKGFTENAYVTSVPQVYVSSAKKIVGDLNAALLKGDDVIKTETITAGKALDLSDVKEAGRYAVVVYGQYEDEDGKAKGFAQKESFFYDVKDPAIDIDGVKPGEYLKENAVIKIAVTDDGEVDKNALSAILTKDKKDTDVTAMMESGIPVTEEGEYTLTVKGADKAGRTSAKKVSFVLDKTAPEISDPGILNGSYLNAAPTLDLAAKDPYLDSLTLTSSGPDGEEKVNGKDGKLSWTPKKDGTYSITVSAEDKAGNASSKDFSFTLDREAPKTKITAPKADGETLPGDAKIQISTEEEKNPSEIHYIVKSSSASVGEVPQEQVLQGSSAEVDTRLFTSDGAYTVTAWSVDKAGNVGEKTSYFFVLDRTAPEPRIQGAEDNAVYSASGLPTITASAKDEHLFGVTLKITGDNGYTFEKKSDGKNISILPGGKNDPNAESFRDGTYTVTTIAEDKAGNTSSKELMFVYDTTAPETKIKSMDEEGSCHKAPSAVTVTTEDKNPDKVYMTVTRKNSETGKTETILKDKEGGRQETFNDFTEDGLYTVTAYSVDKAGNKSKTEKFTVVKDTSAPEVSLSGPEDGGYYQKENVKDASANAGDKNLDKAVITVRDETGKVVHTEESDKDGGFSWKPEEDGRYTVTIDAQDKAGNTATKDLTFTYDTTAPETKIESMDEEGSCHKTPSQVTVTTEDKNPDKVYMTVTRENQETGKKETLLKDKEGSVQETFNDFTEDGLYTVTAYSVDKAGNQSKEETFTVIKDTKAPDITLSGPEEGKYYRGETVKDTVGKINDLNLKQAVITVRNEAGSVIHTETIDKNGSLSWKPDKDDKYTVTVDAEDKAGNTSSKELMFVYDTTAPETKITSSDEEGSCHKTPAEITVTTEDKNPDKVYMTVTRENQETGKKETLLKDKEGSVQETFSSFTEDGLYTITAYSVDKAGNQSKEETFTVIKDTKAPDITLSGPEEGKYYRRETVKDAIGKIDDLNLKKALITVRDESGKVVHTESRDKNGSLSWRPDQDGKYTVTIDAEDKAGNTSSKKLTFTYDTTNPETEIASADKSGSCHKAPAAVTVTTKDKNPDKVYMTVTRKNQETGSVVTLINEREGHLKETFDGFTSDGLYEITAYSVDKAGNISTKKTFKVIKDTIAPAVSLSGASNGKFYNMNRTMIGKVHEANLSKAELVVKRGDSVVAAVSARNASKLDYELTKIVSAEGKYEVTLTAEDRAGNTASKTRSFVVDKTPPITKITGAESKKHYHQPPEITASANEIADVHLSVYRDGVHVYSGSAKNEKAYASYGKDGDYTVKAYSVDRAGNTGKTAQLKFTKDSTAPVITIHGAKEGSYQPHKVTVSVRVEERYYKTDKVHVNVTRTLHGKTSSIPFHFSSDGRISVDSVSLSETGKYLITATAKDEAGNDAKKETLSFYVDSVKPKIRIDAPKKAGAKASAAPKVIIRDDYLKSHRITMEKTFGEGSGKTDFAHSGGIGSGGGTWSFADLDRKKKNDGVYVIRVTAVDRAGNTAHDRHTMIVDRFGSIFEVHKPDGSYFREIPSDIVIKEVNAAGISKYKASVRRDGSDIGAAAGVSKKGYTTTYTISRDTFKEEGIYRVGMVTTDNAGNISESDRAKNGEIWFAVDRTAPAITLSGIESEKLYKQDTVRFYFSAADTISAADKLTLHAQVNGKDLPLKKDGSRFYAELPKGYNMDVSVTATDQAGNVGKKEITNVSVSSSPFAVLLAHKKVVLGAAAGIAAAAAAFFTGLYRRKKKKGPEAESDTLDDDFEI